MPSVTIVDLDNLPQGVTEWGGITPTGNIFTWNNQKGGFNLKYYNPDVPFEAGEKAQLSLKINRWSQNYFRVFARGINASGADVTGLANWSIIEGMTPTTNVGLDANNGVKINNVSEEITVILEIVFVAQSYGFYFTGGATASNLSTAAGTGQVTFLYATSQFEPVDPYEQCGTSGPGGGDGTFDFSSTPIDFQGAPTIGAYATGMIDLYVPTAGQLQSLSNYLWAGAFDPDNFKKLFADPMDAILGLSIVPVTASEIGTTSATLAVGNISTGLSMPAAVKQYVVIDCGSVSILPKWGAYLDFSPYSKLQLFLPYIGFVAISPDDCMNGTIAVRYTVDILSGTCVAQVKCNDHVLYELAGTCSVSCPVTAGQYQNIALTALRTVGTVAGTLAAAAAGNVGGVSAGIEDAANSVIASAKPEIQRSGGFGGSSGLMGHQIPFLILTIPKMCRPGDQNKYIGYPSFVTLSLGTITGYTSIEEIHLENVLGACDDDLAEIVELLKGGVFL